jgi:CO/xanthine dehydrogenase Mo-binding subunit
MARLIRSEKEVEGRYEEVWTLVEEDALDQWPSGPGEIIGRDAPRLDGYEKARGEARYTGDVKLPGMLESALLRSPFARARVRRIDLAAAAAAPGVFAVVGPGEVAGVDEEVHFEGGAVAGIAAETLAQARAALALIDIEWDELEPLLDAAEAVRQGSLLQESRHYERGDYEQGLAQADAVVEAEYTTQTLNHNPLETHECVCEWRGDSLDVYISTQYIWGIRRDLAEGLGLP